VTILSRSAISSGAPVHATPVGALLRHSAPCPTTIGRLIPPERGVGGVCTEHSSGLSLGGGQLRVDLSISTRHRGPLQRATFSASGPWSRAARIASRSSWTRRCVRLEPIRLGQQPARVVSSSGRSTIDGPRPCRSLPDESVRSSRSLPADAHASLPVIHVGYVSIPESSRRDACTDSALVSALRRLLFRSG